MAATIKIKNSSTAGAAPTSSDLVQGELAVNVTDKRLYTENASGTVVELGTNPSVPVTFPDGSASAPSLTNDGDTNTGIFFPAADTIAFAEGGVEALRLDSSGNLGLGVTPSAWVTGSKAIQVFTLGAIAQDTDGALVATNNAYQHAAGAYKYLASSYPAALYRQASGQHQFSTAPSGTAGNAISFTQAMTLDASGNLGIGTTSPSQKLHVNGGAIRVDNTNIMFLNPNFDGVMAVQGFSNVALAFATNNTERARITSGGYFKASNTGTYLSGNYHELYQTATDERTLVANSSNATTPLGILVNYSGASPNDTGKVFLECRDSGPTTRATIRSNGGIANYSANDVNLSDRREKTNFAPAGEYLSKICAIPVQTFNYIDQNLEEDDGLTLGVVAQDVQAVAPELVMESNWGTKENPKMRLSIYQTDLQYALLKCIQELKAEFDAYKATHP